MIIEEIIYLNGACSRKGNGLFCYNSHEFNESRFTTYGKKGRTSEQLKGEGDEISERKK